MAAEPALDEGTTFGQYRVVRLIGRGGMGSVYEARHLDDGRAVAMKVLPRAVANDPLVRARFEREGKIATHLHHPNIVSVSEAGTADGLPYLAMEFLQGEDLGTLLDRERPLPVARVCEVMLPVCAAVGAAHERGIIHRDLKPENIYLSQTPNGMVPKLLDFGISKVAQALAGSNDLTKTSSLLGTPYYMSPEQVRGAKRIDSRTDVYALGVILYECATGVRPFAEENLFNLLLEIVNSEVVRPRKHNPALPEAFEEIILKAIARPLDVRWPNVYQLGRALLPFADAATREAMEATFANPPAQMIATDGKAESDQPSVPPEPPKEAVQAVAKTVSARPDVTLESGRGEPRISLEPIPATKVEVPRPHVEARKPAAAEPASRAPIVVGVAIAAAAMIAYVTMKKPEAPAPPAVAPSSSTAPLEVPNSTGFSSVKHAVLELKIPPGAVVKVNEVTATVTNGKLALDGPLETAWLVRVEDASGKALVAQKVYMADGFTVPTSIDATKVKDGGP